MDRRSLIRIVGLGFVLAVTQRRGAALARDGGKEALAERLAASLRHPASAARVGRAYLDVTPQENSRTFLTEAIASDLRARGLDTSRADRRALRRALAEQISRDFAEGRLARAEGWILARTEARLCALTCLRMG